MQHFTQPAKLLACTAIQTDITPFGTVSDLHQATHAAWRRAEPDCVRTLLKHCEISSKDNANIAQLATKLIQQLRIAQQQSTQSNRLQALLREFSLSSNEGIALMCLAEALLRIPDQATRDALIADKIIHGEWHKHLGQSHHMFVNAAAWGLVLTGKIIQEPAATFAGALHQFIARLSRAAIRKAFDVAMRMMGQQFVTGESIGEALTHAQALEALGFRYSYDMLGEAALTEQDAERYYQDYVHAIHHIGQAAKQQGIYTGPGISIKLSALHPRYERAQSERVHQELYPKVLALTSLAKKYDIGLNIDAEESERLDLSLQLFSRLCFEAELAGWQGLGFVIQAYQKRCLYLIDELIDLAQRSQRRLMIRLVKGAYWDSEIKKAQLEGYRDYPVFTRKVHTDISYLSCAQKLLAAAEWIYPQFATHNAHTVASIYHFAQQYPAIQHQYEFQCLHGMGEALYKMVVGDLQEDKLGIPCRIYAPVGNHETLLAYLVRRLLENGANSSFVNQIADPNIAIEQLVQFPQHIILQQANIDHEVGIKHPQIPLPPQLYQDIRPNSHSVDLNDDHVLSALNSYMQQHAQQTWQASVLGLSRVDDDAEADQIILNPAYHRDIVGMVYEASEIEIETALKQAQRIELHWSNIHKDERAAYLKRTARLVEEHRHLLINLLCRESGKTYRNAISEIRETIDFLYYYAAQMQDFSHDVSIQPLGTVLCISPWNFPLAIFTGQIAAALVCGNPVIAKPAEQTPLIAAHMVQLFWQAGIPKHALQLVPGNGQTVGARLTADARIQGVMFTGSTAVARQIHQTLSQRLNQYAQPVPFIAETGGQNAMIVDSTALTEQVVQDVIMSAFDSAGQRCSALRILCVQEDVLVQIRHMLLGAMAELKVGNPYYLATDIGPVIDENAKIKILQHIQWMQSKGYTVHQQMHQPDHDTLWQGTYVPPTLIEVPHLEDLTEEVFGPVLHLLSYKADQLHQLLEQIQSKGYGLTMGLHSRLNQGIEEVMAQSEVGNLYINLKLVGAVVGVQPFGGEGLSGTGPKAGGPLYVYRLMHKISEKKFHSPFACQIYSTEKKLDAFYALLEWLKQHPNIQFKQPTDVGCQQTFVLKSATGESNRYRLLARTNILALSEPIEMTVQHLLSVFSLGSRVVLLSNNAFIHLYFQQLPAAVQSQIQLIHDLNEGQFDAVLHYGCSRELQHIQQHLAHRTSSIIPLIHTDYHETDIPLERLLIERAVSINTAAAGGNTSLMMLNN